VVVMARAVTTRSRDPRAIERASVLRRARARPLLL